MTSAFRAGRVGHIPCDTQGAQLPCGLLGERPMVPAHELGRLGWQLVGGDDPERTQLVGRKKDENKRVC